MSRHLTIVTGSSRGLGHALALQLLQSGHRLLCLSRSISDHLARAAGAAGTELEQWSQDLAEPAAAAARVEAWLGLLPATHCETVSLINNAGVVTQPGPLQRIDAASLSTALRVGLEAPLLLSAAFLRATQGWRARREGRCKLLFISSGLGRRAMAGQSTYCAAKAGMDHLARALALEQANRDDGAKIVSLAPGVIDTDMQVQLRGSDPAQFPERSMFVQLQSSGQLASPEVAATRILKYLQRADFGTQPIADVRDA